MEADDAISYLVPCIIFEFNVGTPTYILCTVCSLLVTLAF